MIHSNNRTVQYDTGMIAHSYSTVVQVCTTVLRVVRSTESSTKYVCIRWIPVQHSTSLNEELYVYVVCISKNGLEPLETFDQSGLISVPLPH